MSELRLHAPPPFPAAQGPHKLDLNELELSLRRPRTFFSAALSVLCSVLAIGAAIPLFSVLVMLVWRGGARLDLALFSELPPAAGMVGGGVGNAIVGTLLVVALAALMSMPLGVGGGLFLARDTGRGSLRRAVRFGAKLLSGLPSILAGVFAYGAVVLATGRFSPLAGGLALALLMLPTITLTTEEAVRAVPDETREAATGMGATSAQVAFDVLLPTAFPGILTGILLALARAAGETAPLLFTMSFSDYWLSRSLLEPTASLAVLIFQFSKSPFDNQKQIAWAASLVLVCIVLVLTLGGQLLSRRAARRRGGG